MMKTGQQSSKEQTQLRSYRWYRQNSFKGVSYDGQKMYHQMQGVGWGNESLRSLGEPRDGGGPEGAIIRNEEWGRKH